LVHRILWLGLFLPRRKTIYPHAAYAGLSRGLLPDPLRPSVQRFHVYPVVCIHCQAEHVLCETFYGKFDYGVFSFETYRSSAVSWHVCMNGIIPGPSRPRARPPKWGHWILYSANRISALNEYDTPYPRITRARRRATCRIQPSITTLFGNQTLSFTRHHLLK
jgi:hypothetical protein